MRAERQKVKIVYGTCMEISYIQLYGNVDFRNRTSLIIHIPRMCIRLIVVWESTEIQKSRNLIILSSRVPFLERRERVKGLNEIEWKTRIV